MKINIKNKTFKYLSIITLYAFPALTFAQFTGLRGLLVQFAGLLNLVIPVIFGLALVYFFWGTSQFILNAGDAKARDEGKQKMIWGIIALFVMVSIYGILSLVGSLVGIPVQTGPTLEGVGDFLPGTTNA
jgi:hypothetical protein